MHIFISYSSKDNAKAYKMCEYLEKNGKKCFIAPRDIRPGKEYGEELINAIDQSKAMILLLTKESNKSPHVLREVERAVSKSVPIYVCALEEVELSKSMEYFLMTHQWGSMGSKSDYSKILQWTDTIMPNSVETPIITKSPKSKTKIVWFGIGAAILLSLCVSVFVLLGGKVMTAPAKVGDIVVLGSYNEEPIEWRVLKVEENQAVLIAKDILTMRAYDAAESGTFNVIGDKDYWTESLETELDLQTQARGNSDWSVSNIRTWLNSEQEVVYYSDQVPNASAMAELKNGYHNEAGFLKAFSKKELEAIVEIENSTNTNGLSKEETSKTLDRVYLLSKEELKWFDEANMSKLAVPTEAATKQDQSNWYDVAVDAFAVQEYSWWLREPVGHMASQCYLVGNGYTKELLHTENVGLEGYGIRPAITVDLKSEYMRQWYANKE